MSPKLTLPDPFASIPRHPLLYPFLFSPIHPLPSLSSSLDRARDVTRKNRHSGNNKLPAPVQVSLYVKREDHSSPLACAGNKYRKLEYIVPDILSPQPRFGAGIGGEIPAIPGSADSRSHHAGAAAAGEAETEAEEASTERRNITTLVTEGALQSNHTVQVASVAGKLGLQSVVLLHKGTGGGLRTSSDPQAFQRTGNVQVVKLLGSDVRILDPPDPSSGKKTQDDLVDEVLEALRAEGKNPYWIPSGASLHPLGGLGYARCAFEIAEQEREMELLQSSSSSSTTSTSFGHSQKASSGRFDYIFVACGSGSTLGGLIAGFKILEKTQQQVQQQTPVQKPQRRPRQIIGILTSPTQPKPYHEERILQFARQAGSMIGLDPENDITMADIRLDDRFGGTGYGVLDAETKKTLEFVAEREEVILDPVYTAKVMRGLLDWVSGGQVERDVAAAYEEGYYEEQGQGHGHVNALFIHTGGQSALGAYADI
ncbi:tryptophan synthase beta subunit-like PLP-dependent enzyme [Aspergillus pseudoustus]|uniref:Tryptophan synthase beta subunit-like PLP-dependent enzyme n=1 Tax=Aspergillus pseudoustus TaxID=1810923 RepID=A0ABR4K4M1_9EURO